MEPGRRETMQYLYRVVPKAEWHASLERETVPRCPADERHNRIHLNELKDVELAANLWFTPEEEPVVLEIDVSGLAEHLRWEERTSAPHGVWPHLYLYAIPTSHIVRVLALDLQSDETGVSSFKVGAVVTAPVLHQEGSDASCATP